jgi:hypothetical protein
MLNHINRLLGIAHVSQASRSLVLGNGAALATEEKTT